VKRFVVETEDDVTVDEIKKALYVENLDWLMVLPVREVWERPDGKPRMTTKQRDKLWALCGDYNVPFRESDYVVYPNGMVEGWVGGNEYASKLTGGAESRGKKTIYVGVEPNGDSHS
jgi:hypothetical protein